MGEQEIKFVLLKAFVSDKSVFVREACAEALATGQKKAINLTHIGADVFDIYVDWLSTERIDIDAVAPEQKDKTDNQKRVQQIMELYIAGEDLRDLQFCNVVLDEIIHLF